jgi:lipopolysaccharide transport system permease protein
MSFILRSALHVWRINVKNLKVVQDLTLRDFRLRYIGSILGRYWNLIHPLAMIVIYTVIFSQVMGARLGGIAADNPYGYTIYLCSGLLAWNAFAETLQRGTNVFIEHGYMIKKVAFPIETLPSVVAGSSTITFGLSLAVFIGLMFVVGHPPTVPFLAVFAIFILQIIFAFGLVNILGTLNVFFRDVGQLVQIVIQIWFWLTPIVYIPSAIPEKLQFLLKLNPFYYYVQAYHAAIFEGRWPEPRSLLICSAVSAISFFVGTAFFCRLKPEIPDEV